MKQSQCDPYSNIRTLDELQARLDALPGSNNNIFSEYSWSFKTSRDSNFTVKFSAFSTLFADHPNWFRDSKVDLMLITKSVWLALAESTTVNDYVSRLSGLGRLWSAMAKNDIERITRDNISTIIVFLLSHHWHQGRTIQKNGVITHAHFKSTFSLQHLKWALTDFGLDWISPDVTESFVKKQLKTIISDLTDDELTFRDWFDGESFDFLTLDYGRFYIEHCLNFFQKNVSLAIALSKTYRGIPQIANSLSYDVKTVKYLVPRILQGYTVERLFSELSNWSRTTIERVHELVIKQFKDTYRTTRFEAKLLQDSTLEDLIESCGLPLTHENIDRMRGIAWEYAKRQNGSETESILHECQPPVDLILFEESINRLRDQSYAEDINIPSILYYQNIGLLQANSAKDVARSYPRQLIKLVEYSGLACISALTGWRKSEFGFPFSSVRKFKNIDKLDEYACPFRYQVDWYVYKSHGKIRQLREITLSTYIFADQLRQLTGVNDEAPCLYKTTPGKRDAFDSGSKVTTAVIGLWEHYVYNYPGFKLLDDLHCWKNLIAIQNSGVSLTSVQQHDKQRLLQERSADQWDNLKTDGNLKEAWIRSRAEWSRLEFTSFGRNLREKIDWLIKYRKGTLRADWAALLDEHLSQATKDWIYSLSDDDCRAPAITMAINSELLSEAFYPSPHAFRHMWAEAVYRRFDGDAGWIIRSQFKHISRAMWLSYIRDKDNRSGHQRVKRQVISSLVHNYLIKKGEGYGGQLHTWLRRLSNRTNILSPEEQAEFANRLVTTEIEDIKANPWGYCMLKRRTRHKARCAEFGEPMRHNASPDLCLSCAHNLMQKSNAEWTLFHVSPHIEALKNPIVPLVFKKSSYELVKNTERHIRTIDPYHEGLPQLKTALREYKKMETM